MILANVQIERNKSKNAYKQISMGGNVKMQLEQNNIHLFLLYI